MILASGCSFTYGEELLDRENEAYPYVLGGLAQQPVVNIGMMGASNDYIFRETMRNVMDHNPDIVIVQWSEISRIELWANRPINTPGRYTNYTGLLQANVRWTGKGVKFIDEYYTDWWDEKHSLDNWLWQVISLQEFLKSQNKRYIMFNAFGTQEVLKKYLLPEYGYIDPNTFIGWPHEGFVEWSYGTPTMPNGHPGSEGHKRVAEKLWQYLE